MAHNTRTHPDATWTNGGLEGYTPPEADFESLDLKIAQGLNGDKGGTWGPSSPIIVGDTAAAATSPGVTVSGPTLVAYGGSLKSTNGARYQLANYPTFGSSHTSRSRRILTPCMRRMNGQPFHWVTSHERMSIQSIGCTIQNVFSAGQLDQPYFVLPLRVHDGSTLSQATLTFRVPAPRTSAPQVAPLLRILRIDQDGNVVPLKSTSDGTGFVPIAAPTSASGWYANGAAQSFVYTCDQNNVIDLSQYYYEAELVEEQGILAANPDAATGDTVRNRIGNVSLVVTDEGVGGFPYNPFSGLPPAIDGCTLFAGVSGNVTIASPDGGANVTVNPLRVLYNGLGAPFGVDVSVYNGVWAWNGTAFVRDTDLNAVAQFTPGLLVGVELGARYAQTMWELETPFSASKPTIAASSSTSGSSIRFQRRKPAGNMYHAIVCDFVAIPDMRFQ